MSARRQHCSPATICTWLRRGGWAEERRGVGSSPPRRDLSNRLMPHFEYSGTIAECDVLIEVVGRVRRAENHGAVQEAAHIRRRVRRKHVRPVVVVRKRVVAGPRMAE